MVSLVSVSSEECLFYFGAYFYVGTKTGTHYLILSCRYWKRGLKRGVVQQVLSSLQVFSFKNHLDARSDQTGVKRADIKGNRLMKHKDAFKFILQQSECSLAVDEGGRGGRSMVRGSIDGCWQILDLFSACDSADEM